MNGRYRDGIVTRAAHRWLRQRGFHVWKWPERTSNEGNKIRVLAGRCSMDSPEMANGVRINAEQDNGWLRVAVEADDSVKGWALSFNGRDVPIHVEPPGKEGLPAGPKPSGFAALSPADQEEWRAMLREMKNPATESCGCGYPGQECLRVVLRNGPPYPPRPCEPLAAGVSGAD